MSLYLNAVLTLAATLAAFVLLARLANRFRAGAGWRRRPCPDAPARLVAVEDTCAVDGRRRLLSLRCGADRVFVLTGGPADLVVGRSALTPEHRA